VTERDFGNPMTRQKAQKDSNTQHDRSRVQDRKGPLFPRLRRLKRKWVVDLECAWIANEGNWQQAHPS